MTILRSVLTGIILGGAFGAKIGAYIGNVKEVSALSWSLIEVGFFAGAGVGLFAAIAVQLVRSGVLDRPEGNMDTPQLSNAA